MDKVMQGQVVLNGPKVQEAVKRLEEAIAKTYQEEPLAFVGIQTRGVTLAKRLAQALQEKWGREIPVGMLDINLYRDDLDNISHQPLVRETEIPFEVLDKTIILVDDVLYTGRTIRSALDALLDYGRPRAIRLAVLVDRGLRELPIAADFIGHRLNTERSDRVDVRLQENDGEDGVFLNTER